MRCRQCGDPRATKTPYDTLSGQDPLCANCQQEESGCGGCLFFLLFLGLVLFLTDSRLHELL